MLSIALRRRGMEIPADHVAQFLYEGEVIGVVWGSSDPLEGQEDISVWEVFFSASNLCIHRCPLAIPAFPLAQLCSVAWAEEYQHVAAIFKTPNDGMSYGRLLLALFNLSTEVLVCYIDVGGANDPDFPTCDVAISGSPWRIACAAGGALMVFAVLANELSLIRRTEGIQTDHLIFLHNHRLAYIVPHSLASIIPENETPASTQIVSAEADTGVELCRVTFPASFGKVHALTCMSRTHCVSKDSSVVIAFEEGRWPRSTIRCYQLDFVPGQTSNAAVLFAIARVLYMNITSFACTEESVLIGTWDGHVHIASAACHRVVGVSRGDEIEFFHSTNRDHPIVLVNKPDVIYQTAAHGVMRWSCQQAE